MTHEHLPHDLVELFNYDPDEWDDEPLGNVAKDLAVGFAIVGGAGAAIVAVVAALVWWLA